MRVTSLALAAALAVWLAGCSSHDSTRVADKASLTGTPAPTPSPPPEPVRQAPSVTPSGVARLEGDWKVTALIRNDGTSALAGAYGRNQVE